MGNVKTLDEEIAELRTDKKIDAELEAMKAKMKSAGKKG
jgi:phage shock protein A